MGRGTGTTDRWMAVAGRLTGRIADGLPEDGPIVALLGTDGRVAATDCLRLDALVPELQALDRVVARVADGWEPASAVVGGCFVLGTHVWMDEDLCGTLVLILPGYTRETATANMGILESLLGQVVSVVGLATGTADVAGVSAVEPALSAAR